MSEYQYLFSYAMSFLLSWNCYTHIGACVLLIVSPPQSFRLHFFQNHNVKFQFWNFIIKFLTFMQNTAEIKHLLEPVNIPDPNDRCKSTKSYIHIVHHAPNHILTVAANNDQSSNKLSDLFIIVFLTSWLSVDYSVCGYICRFICCSY